jgi:hypothetical protein
MVHWFIRHNVNEHREFIDPGGWRVDLIGAQHAEFKHAFECPQRSSSRVEGEGILVSPGLPPATLAS